MSANEGQPALSVVVATFNRRAILEATLRKLSDQTLPADQYEVIVVDDGSPDDTAQMVDSLREEAPFHLEYLHHENHGPGYTQNQGIRAARGQLVLLLADDIWATPELLSRHVEAHRNSPEESRAVLGKVLQSPQLPPTVLHRHWDPFAYYMLEGKHELSPLHFYACNISVKRAFLLANGLYKVRHGAGNEDTELGYRLGRHGLRIAYEPQALAYHYHEETVSQICRRLYEQGWNFDIFDEYPKREIYPFCNLLTFDAPWHVWLAMLPKAAARAVLFNRVTTRLFWQPVLESAEHFRGARLFACRAAYRGLSGHYFRRGLAERRRTATVDKGPN